MEFQLFDPNFGLIVWTIVAFVIFATVLAKFAWKPMLKALSEREEKIRGALELADKARAEAAAMLKQNEQNIARAEQEYQRVIHEGKVLAEKMKDEIVAKAKQQAQQELVRAQDELKRNVDEARQTLRTEIADLAIQAAEKILDETLDEKKQKQLVDKFIDQLPKN
jgi:F-type H+-transporting ATPase subunit b